MPNLRQPQEEAYYPGPDLDSNRAAYLPQRRVDVESAFDSCGPIPMYPETATEQTTFIPAIKENISEQPHPLYPSTTQPPDGRTEMIPKLPYTAASQPEAPSTVVTPTSEVTQVEMQHGGYRFLASFDERGDYVPGSRILLGPVEQKRRSVSKLVHEVFEDGDHRIVVRGGHSEAVIKNLAAAAQSVAAHASVTSGIIDDYRYTTDIPELPAPQAAPAQSSRVQRGKRRQQPTLSMNTPAQSEPSDLEHISASGIRPGLARKIAWVVLPSWILSAAIHNTGPLITHIAHKAPFIGTVFRPSPYQPQRLLEPWSGEVDVFKGIKKVIS